MLEVNLDTLKISQRFSTWARRHQRNNIAISHIHNYSHELEFVRKKAF